MEKNHKFKNLTDYQFTALLGLVNEPTGFIVEYPAKEGSDLVVRHFGGIEWTVKADGTVGQALWTPGEVENAEAG